MSLRRPNGVSLGPLPGFIPSVLFPPPGFSLDRENVKVIYNGLPCCLDTVTKMYHASRRSREHLCRQLSRREGDSSRRSARLLHLPSFFRAVSPCSKEASKRDIRGYRASPTLSSKCTTRREPEGQETISIGNYLLERLSQIGVQAGSFNIPFLFLSPILSQFPVSIWCSWRLQSRWAPCLFNLRMKLTVGQSGFLVCPSTILYAHHP